MKRSLLGAEKMKKGNVMFDLEIGEMEAEDIAEKVVNDPNLLPELLAGISSTNPKVKFGCAKTPRAVSEKDLIIAAHVVDGSGNIVLANPEFQDRIRRELLGVKEIQLN